MWGENEEDRMPMPATVSGKEDFAALIVTALLCVFGICVAGMVWLDCGEVVKTIIGGFFA